MSAKTSSRRAIYTAANALSVAFGAASGDPNTSPFLWFVIAVSWLIVLVAGSLDQKSND